jgi:hypothetical protein
MFRLKELNIGIATTVPKKLKKVSVVNTAVKMQGRIDGEASCE